MYVGNLSYEVKYRDLIEFMRGGGWGCFSSWPLLVFLVVAVVAAVAGEAVMMASDVADEWESLVSFPSFDGGIVRRRMVELIVGVISW